MYFKGATISFVSVTVIMSSLVKSFGQTVQKTTFTNSFKVLHNNCWVEGKVGGYHK